MIGFKEKNAGDALASARLFDEETGHFDPIEEDSAHFARFVVEIFSFAGSKLRRFRLKTEKMISCADHFLIESRP